jgi:release factor glutamine methyltransferase
LTGEGRGEGGAGEARHPPTLDALLRVATANLAARLGLSLSEARLEAQVLAAHALGVNRAWLIAHGDEPPEPAAIDGLETVIRRRLAGEPTAYLLGRREFFGRDFRVTPDVLIPRPETELLVEAALARLPPDRPATVLDLGTGSGCIAISLALARPDCRVTAVDISPAALAVARDNAVRLGAEVEFLQSDWFAALEGRRFDLIVGNPPYVAEADPHMTQGDLPREPYRALTAGPDGLDALRVIAAGAPAHLAPGGWLLAEHGWDQGEVCRSLFAAAGLEQVQTLTDLAGRDRVCLGRTAQ